MTQKEILTEYTKGLTDPVYIIENYLKAYDKTQNGYVPFKLFPRQVHIIDAYMNHDKNIVTKPRQAGVSTTTAAFLSWRVGFASRKNPEKILILANKQAMAFEFLDKVREFVQQLPRWLWGPDYYGSEENEKRDIFVKNSQKEFELPNKCRVKAVATSKDALRGYTPTFLVFDEAAFIDNGAEVFGAAMSSISTGGAVSLISTPNGNDELYYNTYDQAMKKENNFNIVEMRWYEDLRYNKDLEWVKDDERIKESEYTLEGYKQKVKEGYKPTSSWYRDMCKSLNNDARMIAQELDVSFVGSGSNVIHDDYIKFHQEFNVKEPKFIDGNEKEFWIWEEPKDGHKYILSCDVARGDGTDYSVFTIIDFTDMEQVMEYRGKVPPDVLAMHVKKYADLYDAYVVVDNIGVGVSTVLKLMELGCKNMHYDVPSAGAIRVDSRLNNFTKDGKTPGFNVSKVRLPMIQELEFSIRENVVAIRSTRIIAEMRTFIYKNGRPDHVKGKNDDCLITLAMAVWVIQRHFKQLESNVNQSKAMLDSWALNTGGATSSLTPENLSYNGKDFGTSTDGYVSRGGNNISDDDNLWVLGGMF